MDVVHHIELVLNEVRIWINGLVLITRQLLVGDVLGCYVVIAETPLKILVPVGAAPFHEEFFTLLYL